MCGYSVFPLCWPLKRNSVLLSAIFINVVLWIIIGTFFCEQEKNAAESESEQS